MDQEKSKEWSVVQVSNGWLVRPTHDPSRMVDSTEVWVFNNWKEVGDFLYSKLHLLHKDEVGLKLPPRFNPKKKSDMEPTFNGN